MAKLPTVQSFGARPTPRAPSNIVAFRGGIAESAAAAGHRALAQTIGGLGAAASDLVETIRDGEEKQKLAKARSDFLAAKIELDAKYAQDQDFETAEKRYGEELQKLREKASGGLGGQSLDTFDNAAKVDVARGVTAVQLDVVGKRRDFNRAENADIRETARNNFLTARTPADRAAIMKNTADAIDAARDQKFYTEAEAQKLKRNFAQDVSAARIASQPPEEIQRLLQVPRGWSPDEALPEYKRNGTSADYLDEDKRVELARKAQAAVDALERQKAADIATMEAAEEKRLKKLGEEGLKEAFKRHDEGTLTSDFVEEIRPNISPAQYKTLRKTLRGVGEDANDSALLDLMPVIDTMDPGEFEREAAYRVRNGSLKFSTYKAVVNQNRATFADRTPANPYKSARDFVRGTLEPGQLLSGPAAAIARFARSDALLEFDVWTRANPEATHTDAETAAREIVRRTQVVQFDKMKLAVGVSRYFGNKTRSQIVSEDVDAAERRLFQDVQNGELNEEQAAFEIRRLGTWREILARKPGD